MSSHRDDAFALADAIRRTFDPHPVPAYPPLLGLDPPGESDEYAAFANTEWTAVPPEHYRWNGYDISPVVGFRAEPRMWSYYFPGFMTAALLHEGTVDVMDGLLWALRDIEPPTEVGANRPWWGGDAIFANYSAVQIGCVVRFLRFVEERGGDAPYSFMREAEDDHVLQRWIAIGG